MLTCPEPLSRNKLECGCVCWRACLPYGPEKPRDLALKRLTYQTAVYGIEALTEPTHKRDVPFPAQLSGVIRPTSVRWLCTAPAVSLIVQHHPSSCSPGLTRPVGVQFQFYSASNSQPYGILCSVTILANRSLGLLSAIIYT